MALIYNKILNHFSRLNSVALNANGDLAVVCFNDRELIVYRIVEGPKKINPSTIVNPNIGALEEGGALKEYRFIRLPPPSRRNRPPGARVSFESTKIAFLNDKTLLVAREIEQVGGGEAGPPPEERANINLAAIKIATGEVVAEFMDSSYGPIFAAPLLIPPKYVLFSAANTAICLDTTSFREVFRLREFDEEEAVIGEEESSGEEQIAHHAVAYDSGTGILYVLWCEYLSSFLQTYRLHPAKGSFERLERRSVLEDLEGNSLCLRPDGKEVAVWAIEMDEAVDCGTAQDFKIPETRRTGRLGIFSPEGDRFFDVHSKVELYCAEGLDQYKSKPFYLNDHTVVINIPGAVLVGVDTASGKAERLMTEFSPIQDLCVHHQKRLLLVGTKGSVQGASALNLLGLGEGFKELIRDVTPPRKPSRRPRRGKK
jgi:hypothetical protein